MKKLTTLAATVSVALALSVSAGQLAFADDTIPTEEVASSPVIAEAPPETTVSTGSSPATSAVGAPSPATQEKALTPSPGSEASEASPAISAAPITPVTPTASTPALASVPSPATGEFFWAMPNGGTPDHVTYDQTYSPQGAVTPGVCYQVDTYLLSEAPKFTADGKLTLGEDYQNDSQRGAISWRFVCVPALPTPPATVVTITVPTLAPTPPTCDTAGTLPFLSNPAAQNPNGYEFPGQGFRVYISPAFSGPGVYTATIQKVGAGFDPAFPKGTKVVGATTQTLTVLAATGFQSTDASAPCYVTPPVIPDEPTVPETPTTPATPVTPATPEQTVQAPVAPVEHAVTKQTPAPADSLAYTGQDGYNWPALFVALALALIGTLALIFESRRNKNV